MAGTPKSSTNKALAIFKDLDYGAIWIDRHDVWLARISEDDATMAKLRVGASLADVIATDESGSLERWRFKTPAEAKRAADWVRAHAGKTGTVKGDTRADPAVWNGRMKVSLDRIARLEVGRGPIAMTVDTTHDWIYPRPPSTSWITNRVLVPACGIVGAIDPRFGKRTGVYLSVCPTGMDQVYEIALQDPAKPSAVDAYFADEQLHTIHLGLQVYSLGDTTVKWCVVEHDLEKGTTGYLRTTHCKDRKAAEKLFAERVAACRGDRMKAPPAWYRATLREIDRFHRANGQKPRTLSLRPAYAAHTHAVADAFSYLPSQNIESSKVSCHIDGSPRFCQEEWDHLPQNPCSKSKVLHLLSLQSGDVAWSEILNDGDAGSLTFFAAPGDPFGTMSFSCH